MSLEIDSKHGGAQDDDVATTDHALETRANYDGRCWR